MAKRGSHASRRAHGGSRTAAITCRTSSTCPRRERAACQLAAPMERASARGYHHLSLGLSRRAAGTTYMSCVSFMNAMTTRPSRVASAALRCPIDGRSIHASRLRPSLVTRNTSVSSTLATKSHCPSADQPIGAPSTFRFVSSWVSRSTIHSRDASSALPAARLARKAILVSDLVRDPLAYYGIRLITRLFMRNEMTRFDGPLSVRRALTIKEWRALFREAAVGPFRLVPIFPYRQLTVISVSR